MKQTEQTTIAVGDVLNGKYRVERHLGMGGMGVVVAATHLDLQEERAIKLMRADLDHPHVAERFFREARAVVKLRSEHVAQVHDIGRLPTGEPFIVMELLHGEDLAARLKRRGPLPIHEAVTYIMQACDALSEAHERGIVHRDLKPANLFLTERPDGSPCIKVLDFGVSKHLPREGEENDPEMTNSGDIMGSPLYMAPEQMRSAREVDARADIWALGCILYKLLTGRGPFQRPTVPEVFMVVMGDTLAEPASTRRKDIQPGLDAVIARCLQKNIDARFARAADLKAALSPYSEPWEGRLPIIDDPSSVDEPRSSRVSNSSRPIPRNIDAILLGCIGKDPTSRPAKIRRRNSASDPFVRSSSEPPRASSAPESVGSADVPVPVPSSKVPLSMEALRQVVHIEPNPASPPSSERPSTTPTAEKRLTEDEAATALLAPRAPRLSSFEQVSPASLLQISTEPPPKNELPGQSVAPWESAPTKPTRRKVGPVTLAVAAMAGAFISVSLLLTFTNGGLRQSAAAAPGMRLEAPEPLLPEFAPPSESPTQPQSSSEAPVASASSQPAAPKAPESPTR